MAAGKHLKGLPVFSGNLNREIGKIKGASLDGLLEAGLQIRGLAQAETPVHTGNLKGSAYSDKSGELEVEIGFTAAYAPFVHENLEARHTVGKAKFLEDPINRNTNGILEIIARRAKVGT